MHKVNSRCEPFAKRGDGSVDRGAFLPAATPQREDLSVAARGYSQIGETPPGAQLNRNTVFEIKAVVHLDGESSNTLFEVLAEWERHLTQLDLDGRERGDEASNK